MVPPVLVVTPRWESTGCPPGHSFHLGIYLRRRGNRRQHLGHAVARKSRYPHYIYSQHGLIPCLYPLGATGVSLSGVDQNCGQEEEE